MGTVFILMGFMISFAVGAVCLIAGGICAIIFGIRTKKNKRAAKPIFIISLCIAAFGGISLAAPVVVTAGILIYGGIIMPLLSGGALM